MPRPGGPGSVHLLLRNGGPANDPLPLRAAEQSSQLILNQLDGAADPAQQLFARALGADPLREGLQIAADSDMENDRQVGGQRGAFVGPAPHDQLPKGRRHQEVVELGGLTTRGKARSRPRARTYHPPREINNCDYQTTRSPGT